MRSNRRVADVVAQFVIVVCLGGFLCEAKAEPPPEKEITLDLGDGVQMQFILIPAGEFMMGSRESPADVVKTFDLPEIFVVYLKNEHPRHCVRITKAFYLGKYEVTQQQWQTIMGTNPSFSKGPKRPVETANWNECQAFIDKLNEKSGRPGVKFSLPTEAQWEYACRAGTSTRFSFGDDKTSLGEYVWYGRNSGKKTHSVGQKKPNPWGLYDMHGNVSEWCADWCDEGYYRQSPPNDPTGSSEGTSRVLRGGSFYDDLPDYFRCADRYHDHPDFHYYRYGFRVAGIVAIPPWAKVSKEQIAEANELGVPVAFENDCGVKFVLAPRGEFMMGSPDDEVGRYPEEGPQHKVTMGKAYYISVHQTTQGQWKKAMGTMPWDGKTGAVNNPAHAVNHVTWEDAMAFCVKLKEKDGRSYRLPTEAEWEYACRAGSTTRYCYGDDPKHEQLAEYSWYLDSGWMNPDLRYMHAVGMKKPNNWGIHDMHGNAWELCMDTMHKNYEGAPTDGSAWLKDGLVREDGVVSRVLRGGGLRSTDRRVRTASRYSYPQNVGSYYVGFRIACEITPKAGK